VRLLLDTHILIWWLSRNSKLPAEYRNHLDEASTDAPLWIADISLWEIALLHRLGRIEFDLPLLDWLERATAPPLVRRVGIDPRIAATVAELPDTVPRDPADRIIVATAKVLKAKLMTLDGKIRSAGVVDIFGATVR
jgi:PIN domain nuclease of toxin-antitoxin system